MKNSAPNSGNRDQRIFERISCELNVQFTKMKYSDSETAKALNFSGMGFNILTKRPLKTGEEIEIKIDNFDSITSINQLAKVKWQQETSPGEWIIGLEFSSYNLTKFIPLMLHIRNNDFQN